MRCLIQTFMIAALLIMNVYLPSFFYVIQAQTNLYKANQQKRPLTFIQIERLIKEAQAPDSAIAIEIMSRGIDFELDANKLKTLRTLRVGPKTLQAIEDESKSRSRFQNYSVQELLPIDTAHADAGIAISPDGKYFAYVDHNSGRQRLMLRQRAAEQSKEIVPRSEDRMIDYRRLTFSPDGNYIYYLRGEHRTHTTKQLYKKALLGGEPQRIRGDLQSFTLSPDGKRLAFIRFNPDQKESTLIVSDSDSTAGEKILAKLSGYRLFHRVAWSPNGEIITCAFSDSSKGFSMRVMGINVKDGSEVWSPVQSWDVIDDIIWLPDGNGLILIARSEVTTNFHIWFLSYPGGIARQVTREPLDYTKLSLTADGRELAAVQKEEYPHIWIVHNGDVSQAKNLTSIQGQYGRYYNASWTPEGKILYTSKQNDKSSIWLMNSDGSNQIRLREDATKPVATPDGRYIVFVSTQSNKYRLWRMDNDGSNLRQLTIGDSGEETNPQCSPDSQWIVYSYQGEGKLALRRVSINGGTTTPLFNIENAAWPTYSPDGKSIAYFTFISEGSQAYWHIAVIKSEDGSPVIKPFKLIPSVYVWASLRWTPDGKAITYVNNGNIMRLELNNEKPEQITKFEAEETIFSFDWSADGKQLVSSRGHERTRAVLIMDRK